MASNRLKGIHSFDKLLGYLRDTLGWPIESGDFEELRIEKSSYEYEPAELGLEGEQAAKIKGIQQLRPLQDKQPWGIFFVEFAPKRLPIVVLRRILGSLLAKKRQGAAGRAAWPMHDLLFICSFGGNRERQLCFAHFSENTAAQSPLPSLRVLGWSGDDTKLQLDYVEDSLERRLNWPEGKDGIEKWGESWRSALSQEYRQNIRSAQDLAQELAILAKAIRDRMKAILAVEGKRGSFHRLMAGFKKALLHDIDEKGFADVYAQTICYGLLSACILRSTSTEKGLDLKAILAVGNPFLQELLARFLEAGQGKPKLKMSFDELGLGDVLELLEAADMPAILRDFGDKDRQEDPVVHFYEHFLAKYDPKIRMERGVFYTPWPVVSFIVRAVDEILRNDFKKSLGLAASVNILDPATGTGTFLSEVIDLISANIHQEWEKQGKNKKEQERLWSGYVEKELLGRLYGYELLAAPYTVAQLKTALKLYESGYRAQAQKGSPSHHIQIFLTNALEDAEELDSKFSKLYPRIAKEAERVNEIKSKKKFLVVLGNPPYSGHSANLKLRRNNKDLLSDYKMEPGGKKKLQEKNPKWLNDDYVKFIRYGQYFCQKNKEGILAYINNHSFLDNPTFRGMRWHLLECFDKIYILDLHGNSKKKEKAPDGSADKNVFDIQQGVSINLFIKTGQKKKGELAQVLHYDLFGERQKKYEFLEKHRLSKIAFETLQPSQPHYFFIPKDLRGQSKYEKGFKLNELFTVNSVGIVTARDHFTIHDSPEKVKKTIRDFLAMNDERARTKFDLGEDAQDWKVHLARQDLEKEGGPDFKKITKIAYRPFDTRYTYYTGRSKGFHCRARGEVMRHFLTGENVGLVFRRQQLDSRQTYYFITNYAIADGLIRSDNKGGESVAPLYLYPDEEQVMIEGENKRRPNLDEKIIGAIAKSLGLKFTPEKSASKSSFAPIDLLDYIYAALHNPSYRSKYHEFLQIDFPRIPYPKDKGDFWNLAKLGGQLRGLHLLQSPTVNKPIIRFSVKGKNGKNGKNEIEKLSFVEKEKGLGRVYINKEQYFDGVPKIAWEFYIGGYQPAQKWLKDRKGRRLSYDEIMHYQKIIAALTGTDQIMRKIEQVQKI